MGGLVQEAAAGNPQIDITALADKNSDAAALVKSIDVLIDFSTPAGAVKYALLAAEHQKPLVSGTTGLNQAQQEEIVKAAKKTAIVQAANFSIGVNVLSNLVKEAAARLGPDFKIFIEETHHIHKKDAPSGTALLLARSAQEKGEVPIQSFRKGEVVGDHAVFFKSEAEELVFSHHAANRALFAQGALRAAAWIKAKPPGLYSMKDVLGL